MDLSDLKQSLSQMSDDELRTTLMGIRSNRRVSKKVETKPKASATKKPTSDISLDAILASASPEIIEAMIAALQGAKK